MEQSNIVQPTRTCFKRIHLNPQINVKNFIGCLIHYFMLSFIFVSVDSLQPLLLQKKFLINKSDQIQNWKNLQVIAFDIIVKLITAPIFGYLADRKGRKVINIYGIVSIGITIMLMPYAMQFYQYIILRCFYAQGAIAISVVPLLADYIHHKSRGTCAAILVLMSSIGAVSSAFLNFTILSKIDIQSKLNLQYGTVALIILIVGLFYTCFCIKSGIQYYAGQSKLKKSMKQLFEIFKTSSRVPQIACGYIAAFLARSDSILLSLYLVLWTYSFKQSDYEQASAKASALSGIAYTIIMLFCIVYGFAFEKKNKNVHIILFQRQLMIVMLIFACLGAFLINLATQINHFMTYCSLSILGIGMSGLLTASLFLINEYSNPENRGFLTGIQTFIGVLGISFQMVLGAVTFEYINRNGPFNYFSIMSAIGIILVILVYFMFNKYSLASKSHLTLKDSLLDQSQQSQQIRQQ